jgi:hypothetical protein
MTRPPPAAALLVLFILRISAARAEDAPRIPAPPAVRAVLENHCIICHSDTSADFGRLDLSQWVQTPDGKMGFVQLDANGAQRPSNRTFRVVLDRIMETDPEWRMPLGYILTPQEELAPFKQWLEERIGQ